MSGNRKGFFFYRKKMRSSDLREIWRPQVTARAKRGKERVAGDAAKGTARKREAVKPIRQTAQVCVRETRSLSYENAKRQRGKSDNVGRRLDERKRPPNKQGAVGAESKQSSADERREVTG